jgi:pilus assembly protein CpaF
LFTFEEQPPLSGQGEFRVQSARPFFAHRLVGAPDLRAAVRGLSS